MYYARNKRHRYRRRQALSQQLLAVLTVAVVATVLILQPWKKNQSVRESDPVTATQTGKIADQKAGAKKTEKKPDEQTEEGQAAAQPEKDSPTDENPTELPRELTLVNPWNKLPEDWQIDPVDVGAGTLTVDRSCYADLKAMMDACRAAGLQPLICSAYRTVEDQQELFDNKVGRLKAEGYSADKARAEAAKEVAVPGTSEHQMGLAVDIVDINNQLLDASQEDTPAQKWLMEHSWEYGFIHRYPNGKTDVTGIIYEPWHYRYVGKTYAAEIYQSGLTLEEYVKQLTSHNG